MFSKYAHNQQQKNRKAVCYCRVSSPAQVKRGHGLESQETRCREYARHKNYDVVNVFKDDLTGKTASRPAMDAMLAYLSEHSDDNLVVIIDDINRLARGVIAHWELRAAITDAGGKLESPSIEFGDDSDSILVENLLASVSQHQRQKNAEQVTNRMKARIQNGYYVFSPPFGYRFENVAGHGKMIVPDEPKASIAKEALEGYASGRFRTVTEVKRFLETVPDTPKNESGGVYETFVASLLDRSLYAGYITIEKWGLYLHPGKHEPLIDFATYQKIQDRRQAKACTPVRKDIREDFPLRGFVICADCNDPMTAAWSKGRSTHYPYYFCQNKQCASYKKSIRKEKIEGEFEDVLRTLQPKPRLFHAAKAMFTKLWNHRFEMAKLQHGNLQSDIKVIDKKVSQVMDRLLQTDSETLITAYENQIKKLEGEKVRLNELARKGIEPVKHFDEMFRTACTFLANPWKLWASDILEHKRMVLRLAFPSQIQYCRSEGYRTAAIAEPFRVLGMFDAPNYGLVEPGGIEPPTS